MFKPTDEKKKDRKLKETGRSRSGFGGITAEDVAAQIADTGFTADLAALQAQIDANDANDVATLAAQVAKDAAQDAAAAAEEADDDAEEAATDAEQTAQDAAIAAAAAAAQAAANQATTNAGNIASLDTALANEIASTNAEQLAQDARLDSIEAQLPDDDSALEQRVTDLENSPLGAVDLLIGQVFHAAFQSNVAGALWMGTTHDWADNPKLQALYTAAPNDFITDNEDGTFTVADHDDFLRAGDAAIGVHVDDTTAANGLQVTYTRYATIPNNSSTGGNNGRWRGTQGTQANVTGDPETAPDHRVAYFGIYGDAAGITGPVGPAGPSYDDTAVTNRLDLIEAQLPDDDSALEARVTTLESVSHDPAPQDTAIAQNTSDIATLQTDLNAEIAATDAEQTAQDARLAAIEAQLPDDDTALATAIAANAAALAAEIADTDTDVVNLTALISGNQTDIATNAVAAATNAADIATLQAVSHNPVPQDNAIAANASAIADLENDRVLRTGDIMTGDLILEGVATDLILRDGVSILGTPGTFVQSGDGTLARTAVSGQDPDTGFNFPSNDVLTAVVGGVEVLRGLVIGARRLFRINSEVEFTEHPDTRDDGIAEGSVFYPGPNGELLSGPVKQPDFVQIRSTNTDNINTAAFTGLDFNGVVEENTGGWTVGTEGQVTIPAGVAGIWVSGSVNYQSNGQRVALQGSVRVNGTAVGSVFSNGYIRAVSGHNQASIAFVRQYIPVATGDVVDLAARRESTLTTFASMISGQSHFLIEERVS